MIVYDLETYPNAFTGTFLHVESLTVLVFEISFRKTESHELVSFLQQCKETDQTMVGYNNLGFDEPILQMVLEYGGLVDASTIYDKCLAIIHGDAFHHKIWPNNRYLKQLDLFKIHHFDNRAKSTSLKMLEFVMRSDTIQELPFPVGVDLTSEQVDTLIEYNKHDVWKTYDFLIASRDAIKLRHDLTQKYGIDFMNMNDTAIGKEFFISKLEEKSPGICFIDGKRGQKRQTIRHSINLADVVFPWITFDGEEFNRILSWFKSQTITETKGVFDDVTCNVDGFEYVFGLGGIHGSIESQTVISDDEYLIVDLDVTSYYPRLAMVNRCYPEHLSEVFCEAYEEIFEMRRRCPKSTHGAENAMLKLALNGVYGDSNNIYSPFYDPQYTMTITINGQLLLCKLAEMLSTIDSVEMIQANTDGVTIKVSRSELHNVDAIKNDWENLTGLELEQAEYSRMFIRDVNNYIAEYTDGSVKRKGAYEYKRDWHQNHSALIVPKVAEQHLLHGADIRQSVLFHDDIMDFMLRTKVPRSMVLMHGDGQEQNISRYYISTDGKPLAKIMPPLKVRGTLFYRKANIADAIWKKSNKGVFDETIHTHDALEAQPRNTAIEKGYLASVCNDLRSHVVENIDYSWYIKEVEKLCMPLKA